MSTTYGPIIFPATGQILQVEISQETAAMIVENQSLLDVLFSVAPATPQVVTQASAAASIAAGLPITNGGWDLHVGPRQAGVLQIPDSSKTETAHGRYWTGTVWVQQVNITNALVAAGSFVSNPGANVWVTAYGPGERIPDSGLTSIGYFLASQERMIAVPVTPALFTVVDSLLGATSTWTTIDTKGISNFPFNNQALTAGIGTSGNMFVLIYNLTLTMFPLSAVAGTAESQHILLRWAVFDSTPTLVATTANFFNDFFEHLALQGANARSAIALAHPMQSNITVTPGTPPYTLQLQMWVDSVNGGGGTNIKRMAVQAVYDIAAITPTGAGGGLFGLTAGSTYTGFVF